MACAGCVQFIAVVSVACGLLLATAFLATPKGKGRGSMLAAHPAVDLRFLQSVTDSEDVLGLLGVLCDTERLLARQLLN